MAVSFARWVFVTLRTMPDIVRGDVVNPVDLMFSPTGLHTIAQGCSGLPGLPWESVKNKAEKP